MFSLVPVLLPTIVLVVFVSPLGEGVELYCSALFFHVDKLSLRGDDCDPECNGHVWPPFILDWNEVITLAKTLCAILLSLYNTNSVVLKPTPCNMNERISVLSIFPSLDVSMNCMKRDAVLSSIAALSPVTLRTNKTNSFGVNMPSLSISTNGHKRSMIVCRR